MMEILLMEMDELVIAPSSPHHPEEQDGARGIQAEDILIIKHPDRFGFATIQLKCFAILPGNINGQDILGRTSI